MKKVFFLLICFVLNISYIYADNVPNVVSITNKCSVIKEKTIIVPVKVIALNDGVLTNLIDEYNLGKIDNVKDNMIININNVSGANINKLLIDYNRDENNRSYLKYSLNKDLKLNKLDRIIDFELEIKFNNDIPDSLYVLGNEIIVSNDKDVCDEINGFEIKEIERIKYVNLKETDHSKFINEIIIKVILVILILIILSLIMFIVRNRK